MPVVVRPARADDLVSAEGLVVRSINDLTVRQGFGPIAESRSPKFQTFCLQDDPRGVWLGEDNGEIVGFALSWICEGFWFLAELFVAPGRQGQGLGRDLLERTLRHASEAGALDKGLITFASNVVSQALYVRHGLLPRVPVNLWSIEREALSAQSEAATLRAIPIRGVSSDFEALRRLDIAALGISREKHHRYLLVNTASQGVLLEDGDECVGYAYVTAEGHVGPLAVLRPQTMPAAFRTALTIAAAGRSRRISAFAPGPSEATAIASEVGMRLTLPMMLMTARDFGDWTRYLPCNPGFM